MNVQVVVVDAGGERKTFGKFLNRELAMEAIKKYLIGHAAWFAPQFYIHKLAKVRANT